MLTSTMTVTAPLPLQQLKALLLPARQHSRQLLRLQRLLPSAYNRRTPRLDRQISANNNNNRSTMTTGLLESATTAAAAATTDRHRLLPSRHRNPSPSPQLSKRCRHSRSKSQCYNKRSDSNNKDRSTTTMAPPEVPSRALRPSRRRPATKFSLARVLRDLSALALCLIQRPWSQTLQCRRSSSNNTLQCSTNWIAL